MTTLSSATQVYTPPATPHAHSGKSRMAEAIARQQQAGALSSTDATALTSALGSIDSSLQGDAAAGVSGSESASGGNRLDPSDMKDRIDGLISDQVSSGALTSDQASELQNLFASQGTSVTASTGTDGGAPPPPGPPPSEATSDGSSATDSSSATTSTNDLLSTFIQQLQAAQASGSGYAASGATASTQAKALLFDFKS